MRKSRVISSALIIAVAKLLASYLVVASAASSLVEGSSVGSRVWLKAPFYGCIKPADEAKVADLVDKGQFVAGMRTAIRAGCRHFNAGPIGVVNSSGAGRSVCILPDGERECFWLPSARGISQAGE
jgi:hypothetical protein